MSAPQTPPAPVGTPAPAAGDGQAVAAAEKNQKRAATACQRADDAVRGAIDAMAATIPGTLARDEARRALDAAVAKREDARRKLVAAANAKLKTLMVKL